MRRGETSLQGQQSDWCHAVAVAEYTSYFCLTIYVKRNFCSRLAGWFGCFLFWNPRLSGGLFLPINEGRGLTGRGGGGEGGPVWIMQGSYCFMFQSGFHNNDFIVKF